jgi:hypothetical protein
MKEQRGKGAYEVRNDTKDVNRPCKSAPYRGGARAPMLLPLLAALYGCAATPDHGAGVTWGGAEGGATVANGDGGGSSGNPAVGGKPDGGGTFGNLDGGAAPPPERCGSVGTTRTCCIKGIQTCSGGTEFPTWGSCLDGTGAVLTCPADAGCVANEFGAGCDAGSDAAPDAGVDSGTPDGGCGPGMTCKPGAVRYCDVAGMEWTQSVCDMTGNWGPCVPAIAPQGAGCDQSSFMPEVCCPPLHLCCQDNPGGPWKDWSSGGCAAISCP